MFNVGVHILARWNNAQKYTQSYNRNRTKNKIEVSKMVSYPCTGNSQREISVSMNILYCYDEKIFECEFEKKFELILQKSFDFFAVLVLVSMLMSGIWNRLVLKGMTNRVCFGILSFIKNYHHVKIHFYIGFLLQSVILSKYFRQFMEDCLCEVHKRFTPHVASRKRTCLPRNGTYCRKPRQICTILFHLARAPEKAVRTPDCGLKQLRGSTLCKKNDWDFLFILKQYNIQILTSNISFERFDMSNFVCVTVLKFKVVVRSPQFRRCHFRRLCSGTCLFFQIPYHFIHVKAVD